jgi:3-hydroxymyristoyl/3-hydroxydecanoyl-(acyl carrier protein) dehydratase
MTLASFPLLLKKPEIENILPHRFPALLLDEVKIDEALIRGSFLVTEEVCQGHVFNGQPIFRGSDFYDMAAQLLGVYVSQWRQIKGIAFVRSYGEARFFNPVYPNQELIMELERNKVEFVERLNGRVKQIIGLDFKARVDDTLKATISRVELVTN